MTLLKVQIGPVQDFIAQARSTRDLWSGSYLLSWLVTAGLCKLARLPEFEKSPGKIKECVIFPNLENQPLYEFQRSRGASRPSPIRVCLIPNVPNLFVALVPLSADETAVIAREIATAIQDEWTAIAEAVWNELRQLSSAHFSPMLKTRFDHQVSRFLSISWQVTPAIPTADVAQKILRILPLSENARAKVAASLRAAADNSSPYAAHSALNGWQLDAVRQVRDFKGWAIGKREIGKIQTKDTLTGREEFICGGQEWWVAHLKRFLEDDPESSWLTVFRERNAGDVYGATSLIKSLWHRTYLKQAPWNLEDVARALPIPSTWQAANRDPDKREEDERDEPAEDDRSYFAILAMDGDEMGKWLSGDKNLAVDRESHQVFSASLSEFAVNHAAGIVKEHQGCLIYAGGDDVLALLPSDTALACAAKLRNRFRAVIRCRMHIRIEASVGIAIAHFKAPLQDVVREAQRAESRAKNELGRAAVSVTLLKRSGETVQWGCRWASQGVQLYKAILTGLSQGTVSAKFPHRIAENLTPYLVRRSGLRGVEMVPEFAGVVADVIAKEVAFALERQRGTYWKTDGAEFTKEVKNLVEAYLAALEKEYDERIGQEADLAERQQLIAHRPERLVATKLKAIIGLCETIAFAHRTRDEGCLPANPHPQSPAPAAERQATS